MSSSIQETLRNLRTTHTYIDIHSELLRMMKSEYNMLRTFFENTPMPSHNKQIVVEISRQDPLTEHQIEISTMTTPKPGEETSQPTPPIPPQLQPTKTIEIKKEGKSNSQEMRKWQKGEEEKKLAELKANGIDPNTLFTVENLRKWIEVDGNTYAYVARQYLGIPEYKVSEFGKKHDIKSKISRKRAILASEARVKKLRG
jgi:hypothetical protein